MSTRETVRQRILRMQLELGIEPKKSLGQNFLINDHAIQKIIAAARELAGSYLLEIGPGLGSLTAELLQLSLPMTVIELDHVFAKYWREQGLTVFEQDALQWDWASLLNKPQTVLVSNLPYQISSSLVIDRSLDSEPLAGMVLMFQKEVAQRIRAPYDSEAYGMLSVMAQTFWTVDTVLDASSGDFMPPPKVASRVLRFKSIEAPVQDRSSYLRFLKGCFLHPRKMMISNLTGSTGRPRAELETIFGGQGLDLKIRAQQLKVKQFVQLFQALGYS